MVKFLGPTLDIPAGTAGTHAVRKSYVDTGYAALDVRVTDLELNGGGGTPTGGQTLAVRTTTSAITAAAGDFVLADSSGGQFIVTLPAAPPVNTAVAVKKVDNSDNLVTVKGTSPALIDGDSDLTLLQAQSGAVMVYDGTNWRVESTVIFDPGAENFTYRGTWTTGVDYGINDVVFYQGSGYVAKLGSNSLAPTVGTTTAEWGLLVAKGDKGDAAYTYKGDWSASITYVSGDVVLYQGSSYLALATNSNTLPPGSITFWAQIAAKGDTGSTGAQGPQGVAGATGSTGSTGAAATVAVGTTTTGAAGSSASVTNTGTSSAAVLDFTVPQGAAGPAGTAGTAGAAGTAATIAVGTTTTGAAGSSATVANSGTSSAAVFNFTVPRGNTGTTGTAATVAVGTTTTGAAGSNAAVTNTGTSSAAVLDFTIPQGAAGAAGAAGATGSAGTAATVAVGTTTTGAAGSSAAVNNSGTSSAAVFNFTIPQGAAGAAGAAGTSFSWKGAWTAIAYAANDVVYYKGNAYLALQATTSGQSPTQAAQWSKMAGGMQPLGSTWASGTTYYPGDVVFYNGSTYVGVGVQGGWSGSGATPSPAGDTSSWARVAIGIYFRGAYGSGTTYKINDVVTYGGQPYIAINTAAAGFSGQQPDTATSYWTLLAAKGADGAAGAAATVAVGTTTTGAVGTSASVTNSGSSSAAVFNFTIPRGQAGGGLTFTAVKTAAYTAVNEDFVLADATSAAFTVTLPAGPATGATVGVKKVDTGANAVTVVGSGGTTIDADTSVVLGAGTAATMQFDGSNWRITSTAVIYAGG